MSGLRPLLLALVACATTAKAQAQSQSQLLESGIEAYGELDLETATDRLQRSLATGAGALSRADRQRAWTYLGATHVILGNADSAAAAFRNVVFVDPRYRPDELIFPPEVSLVFEAVRVQTKTVSVAVPRVVRLSPRNPSYRPMLYASSFHEITVGVEDAGGRLIRSIYSGVIGDSLEVQWDARDEQNAPVPSGRYLLTVGSRDARTGTTRLVRTPLDIEVERPDTLPLPQPLADSVFLPEESGSRVGTEALVGGLAAGLAVLILPSAVASGSDLSSARFGIAAALTLSGAAGFLVNRPGRPIPANIESNRVRREEWERRRDEILRTNEARRATLSATIQAGTSTTVEIRAQ